MPANWKIVTMMGGETCHHIAACLGREAQLGIGDASQRQFQLPQVSTHG